VVNPEAPHLARVWDYWLGGKDNYAADRAVGDSILTAVPRQRRHVRANRAFLTRVVRHLVEDYGIRQILDIGSGLPTSPNVHEIAHAVAPDTRVVYVDNDPLVLAHARALLPVSDAGATPRIAIVDADLRDPTTITEALASSPLIDPDVPTAVLVLAMLMSLTDEDRPREVVEALMKPLPPGSFLAVTHTTADLDPLAMDGFVRAARQAGIVFTPRTLAEVERLFGDLELVAPGVVPVQAWRPTMPVPDPRGVYIYAGLGRKR
jgi:S-adenosyl methyltransferase